MIGLTTGLVPSMTLGCGTFGGTSTTDNVTYTHLLNIKRIAYYMPERAGLEAFGTDALQPHLAIGVTADCAECPQLHISEAGRAGRSVAVRGTTTISCWSQ